MTAPWPAKLGSDLRCQAMDDPITPPPMMTTLQLIIDIFICHATQCVPSQTKVFHDWRRQESESRSKGLELSCDLQTGGEYRDAFSRILSRMPDLARSRNRPPALGTRPIRTAKIGRNRHKRARADSRIPTFDLQRCVPALER